MYTNARGMYETKGINMIMNMMNMNMNLFINLNNYCNILGMCQICKLLQYKWKSLVKKRSNSVE